ncbi:MAG: hypothetical protein ACI4TC_01540 [Kiritimatiellia bacterium]
MIVRHRDRELLRFDWVEPFGVKNVELNRSALQFLPIDVRRVAEKGDARALTRKLEDWLMKRVAPMSRAFVRQLLEGLGFDSRDPRHLRKVIEFCRGLSLNDVHWVVEDSFNGCWADFNLYDNPFPESVAGLAFAGQGRVDVNHASTSPEMTTNGNLAKCWRRETKGIFLYKAGHAMTGTEPYSEYYAAQLASALNLPHVDYRLGLYKKQVCSICPLFTSDRFGFLPAGRLMDREEAIADPRFADIFFFDALILNPDRHLGNFGFLVDNETNEIAGVAPIFDNGHGLFSQAPIESFLKTKGPCLYDSWLGFPGGLTDSMRARLEGLSGFAYRRDKYYNLPADVFARVQKFQQKRISEMLHFGSKADEFLTKDLFPRTETPTDLEAAVLEKLTENPRTSRKELATALAVGTTTVSKILKSLSQSRRIRRIGSARGGYWKMIR